MFEWPWTSKRKIEKLVEKTDKTVIHLRAAKTKLDRALEELEGILKDDREAPPATDK